VVESQTDLVCRHLADSTLTFVNDAYCRFVGRKRDELLGRKVLEFVMVRSHEAGPNPLATPYPEQGGVAREIEMSLPDASTVWYQWTAYPVRGTDGKVMEFQAIGRDITARKKAEAEVLRQRAELAHVARVATMGELASSIAHELNQPLGAILANAEAAELFLQQDPPALDDLRAILIDIRKDDERAGEVIRRMRELLRKREMERQPLEINSLVGDVLQFVSGDASLRGISLAADLGPVPKVFGDHIHLQQVLVNLILNGMDALAGQPRERRGILVRTRLVEGGIVEVSVIDSGHGIEPLHLPHLFEPFYTTKPSGLGIGLSIARTIIEAHHGRIVAENNPSGGAVFRILLPISGGRMAR
jgi:PAS domain S-box-containing protein